MAKRRTRKQKEQARHQFTLTWQPQEAQSDFKKPKSEAKFPQIEADVKRQTEINLKTKKQKNLKTNYSDYSEKINDLASIKKDLVKSLILAGLILASEVVLYLFWR